MDPTRKKWDGSNPTARIPPPPIKDIGLQVAPGDRIRYIYKSDKRQRQFQGCVKAVHKNFILVDTGNWRTCIQRLLTLEEKVVEI